MCNISKAFYVPQGTVHIPLCGTIHAARQSTRCKPQNSSQSDTLNFNCQFSFRVSLSTPEKDLKPPAARLTDIDRIARLRDALYDGIKENIPGVIFNGSFSSRLPGILNLSFEGVQSEGLIHLLDLEGIEVSSGSARNSGSDEPSHVLTSMNAPALSAVRFSLSHETTEDDIEYASAVAARVVKAIRNG